MRGHQKFSQRACLAFAVLLCGACEAGTDATRVPAPDVANFELSVYPILLRDCGFPECHGARDRFFRVFGPGRARWLETTPTFAVATPEELEHSYARARSMLAHEKSVAESWLLRKPLAVAAGGAEHGGDDKWGRNVYESVDAPGYAAIARWAFAQGKSPAADAGVP